MRRRQGEPLVPVLCLFRSTPRGPAQPRPPGQTAAACSQVSLPRPEHLAQPCPLSGPWQRAWRRGGVAGGRRVWTTCAGSVWTAEPERHRFSVQGDLTAGTQLSAGARPQAGPPLPQASRALGHLASRSGGCVWGPDSGARAPCCGGDSYSRLDAPQPGAATWPSSPSPGPPAWPPAPHLLSRKISGLGPRPRPPPKTGTGGTHSFPDSPACLEQGWRPWGLTPHGS